MSQLTPGPTEAPTALPSTAPRPQIVLGGVDRAAVAADVGSGGGGISLGNYASIVLALGLFGGIFFFLFRRRSRLTKLGAGSPAVLQPQAGAPSPALPSTLNEGPQPSSYRDAARPRERSNADEQIAARAERRSAEARPASATAPHGPKPSPIVELHFVPEHKADTTPTTGPAPLLAALTEADVVEGTDLPASA